MLQSLYLTTLLLTAVGSQTGDLDLDSAPNTDLDPGISNIVPLPPALSDTPSTQPPPSPSPPSLPSTTTTTTTTTATPPHKPSEDGMLGNGGLSKGEYPPGLVVSKGSIGPFPHTPARSCSFTVGAASNFHPSSEGFGYPEAVIEQVLKGSVAEKALQALQEARLRTAYGTTTTNNNNVNINNPGNSNNNNINNNNNHPFLRRGNPGNSFSINGDPSSLLSLPPVLSPINGLNGLSLRSPSGSSRQPLPSPALRQGVGDSGPSLNSLLRHLHSGDANTNNGNVFRGNSQAGHSSQPFEQQINQLFPKGGSSDRFPQDGFFSPDRFHSQQPAPARPLDFFQSNGPLKTGSGSDIIYDVKGSREDGATPFDDFNPFQVHGQFPPLRRNKRQTRAGGQVSDVCESTAQLLRQYRHHGGLCYVIRPLLQQVTFVSCSNSACSKCQYPGGATRCLPDTRGVALWAYCESGPLQQTVGLDFIHLPVLCSCSAMACS